MKDVLIVIPAYNEENSISKVLEDLIAENIDSDILLIDDGSSDHTASVARKYPIYYVHHPVNLGYGAALQTGFKFASQNGYRYVVQYDGDGQHEKLDLLKLIEEMRKGEDDVVIGSRFLGNAKFHPGWMKMMAIVIFRRLIFWLTRNKITDPTSGLRGLSRGAFQYYAGRNNFPSDFPDADIIIQMLLQRFQVREIPIGSKERSEGTSMHSGLRPMVYFMKVLLSITAVLLHYLISKRRK